MGDGSEVCVRVIVGVAVGGTSVADANGLGVCVCVGRKISAAVGEGIAEI